LPQAKYLSSRGWDCKVRGLKFGQTGGIKDFEMKWADIIVIEMTYSPEFIKAAKKSGAKIIYEMDDLMHKVSKTHYAYKDLNPWRTFLTFWSVKQADAITATTTELKKHYQWFNQNFYVLPNYLDLSFWEKPYLPNTSPMIRLGWSGGKSHKEDLLFIAPVIEKVLKKYKNVKFVCCGYGGTNSPDRWVEYNYGEKIFKNLPPQQYEFSLGAPMEVWPSKLSSMRFDIGIAPVVENVFSKCKSNCKALEYGINRVPGVYQKFLYKDAVIEGKTGLLATTEKEWFDKICWLVENESKRKEMGKAAYSHIKKNFNFISHAHKWENVYKSLLA